MPGGGVRRDPLRRRPSSSPRSSSPARPSLTRPSLTRPSLTRPTVTLQPVPLADGLLVLRSPTLADGPAWSAARLANRAWLERAYPAWGTDWEAEQSEIAWAQRWWRLQRLARAGRALPFVITLDGRLVGEVAVEDVDPVSGAGEASVWMVRSHGSAQVMNAASLLVIEHAFTKSDPLDRMLSPVATSSRRGRSPGLSAVGFRIEGEVPRRVGDALVDHDIWVLHNTSDTRRRVGQALRSLAGPPAAQTTAAEPPPDAPPTPRRRTLAVVAGRAALREARAVATALSTGSSRRVRRWTPTPATPVPGPPDGPALTRRAATRRDLALAGRAVAATPGATGWAFENDGEVVVLAAHATDAGTATTQVSVAARPGTPDAVLGAALAVVCDEVRPAPGEQRVALVRVPLADATAPHAGVLAALGLDHVATFPGTREGGGWAGEDVWRVPTC